MIKHQKLYFLTQLLYYILYIGTLFGVFFIAPEYLTILVNIIKIYICILLIWRFHPFSKCYHINDHDREMIFSSAIFLILTTSIGEMLIQYNLSWVHPFKSLA